LGAVRRQEFGDGGDAKSAAERGEEKRKKSESSEREGRAGGDDVAKGEEEAEDDCEAEEKMSGKGGGPHFVSVNASDHDLAIGEFEEGIERSVDEGNDETFGKKLNGFAAALESDGHGEIVADGALPFIENAALIEFGFANGGTAAPAEIGGFFAEHGDDGRVPGGEEHGGEIGGVGKEPAHGGGGGVARVAERGDHAAEPGFAVAAIGIDEDERVDINGKLSDGVDEIVDLFAAAFRSAGEEDGGFDAGLGGDAFGDGSGGIGFGGEHEKEFVILMIEFAKGDEILFEAGFGAAAGTDDGGARRIETGIDQGAAPGKGEPRYALHGKVEAEKNLNDSENFEKEFHARGA